MQNIGFDESNIRWKQIEGIDHLWLSVLDVDRETASPPVLYKFAANEKIILHRHLTLNKTFTLAGEHRIYHADGRLKEIRPVGRLNRRPGLERPAFARAAAISMSSRCS